MLIRDLCVSFSKNIHINNNNNNNNNNNREGGSLGLCVREGGKNLRIKHASRSLRHGRGGGLFVGDVCGHVYVDI